MEPEAPVRATATDVARRAGLSRSTVSQILNGHGDRFHESTRQRVAEASSALGYRPSRAGRALLTGLTEMVIVVVPNVTFGRHLQDAVDRIAATFSTHGMSVVVRYSGDDRGATLTTVLDLRPARVVDLGVFDQVERAQIEALGITITPHYLEMGSEQDPSAYVGRIQAGRLLEDPRRRLVVALLADERLDAYGPARLEGATQEALERGRPAPLVTAVPLDRTGAHEALAPILMTRESPLGFCCYNDDVAFAVLAVARDLHLSIPDDVAVVGVDHTPAGQLLEQPLTTVSVDTSGILELGLVSESTPDLAEARRFIHLVEGATT